MSKSDLSGSLDSGTTASFGRRYTPLQQLFLKRLMVLLDKRRQLESQPAADDGQKRMLNKALYSTFVDCVDLGTGDEAKGLLQTPGAPSVG
jgi:hypothetical protein